MAAQIPGKRRVFTAHQGACSLLPAQIPDRWRTLHSPAGRMQHAVPADQMQTQRQSDTNNLQHCCAQPLSGRPWHPMDAVRDSLSAAFQIVHTIINRRQCRSTVLFS